MKTRTAVVLGLALTLSACTGASSTSAPAHSPQDPPKPAAASSQPEDNGPVASEIRNGESALQAGNFEEAKKVFSKVTAEHPTHPRATFYLGVSFEKLGDKTSAETHYRQALKLAPNLTEATLNLSAMLIEAGRHQDAVTVLKDALARNSQDPRLSANMGFAQLGLRENEAAAASFRKALEGQNSPEIRLALAETLINGKKTADAIVELKKILPSASKDRPMLATLAGYFGKAGAYGDCVAAYDAAIGLEDAAELHVRRGICRHELKDETGAKADYEMAIALDGKYAPAYFYLGEHQLSTGKTADGIKALDKCALLAPDSPVGKRAAEKAKAARKKK